MAEVLTWRGITASYTKSERAWMRKLATKYPDEAEVVHALMSLGGSIVELRRAVRETWPAETVSTFEPPPLLPEVQQMSVFG